MGKELARFEDEYKKIRAQCAGLTVDTGVGLSQRVRLVNAKKAG
jgi:hypothetical protein